MSATQRGTNRTSPNATISQQYDYANLPTEPLAFYVSPFDGLTFEEVVTKIPNINKELEFAYMRRLQELYDLPESFSTDELLAFLRSLINFNKNNTIELVDERLQELSEEQYIGTLEALKGDITKGSLSVNVNLEQLKKDLIKFGVTRGVAELVEKAMVLSRGTAFHGSDWNKMEIYEINHSTITLTVLLIKSHYSNLRVTTPKVLRFFQTVIVGEMFASKIIVRPPGFELIKEQSKVVLRGTPKRTR